MRRRNYDYKRTQMTRSRSLRQIITKTWGRVPQREPAEESASLTERIEFAEFRIDLDERTVTLDGQELRLTPEEFDVLVFPSSHPQRIPPPRTILPTHRPATH